MLVAPGFTEAAILGETDEGLRARWTLILIGYVSTLFLTMSWAEHIGAGPFAASMQSDRIWLMIGLGGGPIIVIAGNLIAAMIFSGGDPNWALQNSDDARAFSEQATSGIVFMFAVIFAAPVLEEVAYRGVGLGCLLSRGWPPMLAGFVVTLLFTLTHFHLTPPALIPVFVAGAFFAWLRIQSGSLAPSLIAHIAANTAVYLL